MKENEESDFYYLTKGYRESQGFLFRLGAMFYLRDGHDILNLAYKIFFELTLIFFIIIIFPYTIVITLPSGDLFPAFQALHYWFTTFGYGITSLMYHIRRESIEYVLITIGKGFYKYDEDEPDEEVTNIVRKNKNFLSKLTKRVMAVVFITCSGVVFVSPVVEYAKMGGEIPEDAIINPYLPLPFVAIWDTMDTVGYIVLYILCGIGGCFISFRLLALSMGYTSLLVVYTTQFTLLNLSILNIEKRATKRYQRMTRIKEISRKKFMDPVFQECMCFCLKENIKHHQSLLVWIKEAEKFLGWALLITFTATSILLAASGYLLMMSQNSFFNALVLVQVQLVELIHSYLFCWWGQNLAEESSKLPVTLYSTPWIYCNKKFKTTLKIMICRTNQEVIPKDPIFKLEASLETYKSIISTGYSYFNLLRSMS